MSANGSGKQSFDVVVVGAGFAGLYAIYRLQQLGLHACVLEQADGVGGTWYWNRYPGARCDVESLLYSYSFSDVLAREWTWSERYATQPEILKYLNFVADRFDLRRHIRFEERVVDARYADRANHWFLKTASGLHVEAPFCIMATGCLSEGILPAIPGMDQFKGSVYRTSAWPKDGADVAGKRIGVIGTGSSAIQAIPLLAQAAAHVTVFQRTANYSLPAQNTPHEPDRLKHYADNFAAYRADARRGAVLGAGDLSMQPAERGPSKEPALAITAERLREIFERRWGHGGGQFVLAFPDLMVDQRVNDLAAKFIHDKIDEIVRDPKTAAALKPSGYPLGSKRVCVDTGYYATFNRDNVALVDIKSTPIECVSATGIQTAARHYPLDVIVYATGFDAITGALLKMDIRGRDGLSLREEWAQGARTFLGVAMAGFPNLFIVTGPGSPSVLSNMAVSIEQHVEWISECIAYLRQHGYESIEATRDTQEAWMSNVAVVADQTLFSKGESWYKGSNIPGKPRLFLSYLGGVGTFRALSDAIAQAGYQGFILQGPDTGGAEASAARARELWEQAQARGASWSEV